MRFEKLEGMRGFAAIYVVLHHSVPPNFNFLNINLGFLFRFGQEAVILFFILSGFVVNYSYQKSKNKDARVYFFKRFNRIYIPLFCVFIVSYLLVFMKERGWPSPQLDKLFLNLLMLQDIPELKPNVLVSPYLGNSPLWSLSYEWWFYMLYFPLQKIKSNKNLAMFVFITSVASAFVYAFYPNFVARLLMYFGIWWSGVYLSNLILSKKSIDFCTTIPILISLAALSIISLIAAIIDTIINNSFSFGIHPWLEVRHFSFAFICIISGILWKKVRWAGYGASLGLFEIFAPVSYTIYIAHYPLLINADYLSFMENGALETAFYVIILFIFAWLVELKLFPKLNASVFSFILPTKTTGDNRTR